MTPNADKTPQDIAQEICDKAHLSSYLRLITLAITAERSKLEESEKNLTAAREEIEKKNFRISQLEGHFRSSISIVKKVAALVQQDQNIETVVGAVERIKSELTQLKLELARAQQLLKDNNIGY